MRRIAGPWSIVAPFIVVLSTLGAGGDEPEKSPVGKTPSGELQPVETNSPAAVDAARQRAQTMHELYAATLETMHEHYFHGERAIVPARALEDVFAEIARQSQVEARWISVNTRPMSVRHEPKSEFEQKAATALARGEKQFELVEKGFYQRAGVIPLAEGCVACHTGFFKSPPKSPRVAGLVIRVPLQKK